MLVPLLLSICQTIQPTSDLPLKVMTFNVRYGTAADEENAWNHRKDLLVETIREYDPDIVGTQECLDFQARYIVEQLPEYEWYGIGRDRNGRGEHTAILYKRNHFVPVEGGNFWLSDTPHVPASVGWDAALTRLATWKKFHHHPTGHILYVYNTHFDHRGEIARINSAELLAERMAEHVTQHPVILLGDFNALAEESLVWEAIARAGFRDAWIEAPERIGPAYTFNGWRPLEPDRVRRIDWIKGAGPVSFQLCETVIKNDNGRWPSDHFPVFAELNIMVSDELQRN